MLCRNCWDTEQLHTQTVWRAQIRFSWGHTALQMHSEIPLQSWISVAFYVQRTLEALRWVSNTAKHFPKQILCSFFSQNMALFSALYLAGLLRCAAVWQRLPAAQTRARLQNRSYLEQSQNSSERRCSPPLAAAPTQRITGANMRLPWWRSERPASVWPWGSSGWRGPSVSGPARPAAPGPARAGAAPSGSASCRTPRSGCTRAPRLREDTKRIFFCFFPAFEYLETNPRAC